MGKKPILGVRRGAWTVLLVGAALFLFGCATPSSNQSLPGEAKAPLVESVRVNSSLARTVVEIGNSKAIPYTTFKLMDPPRLVLDIQGKPGKDLPLQTSVYNGNVREILFQEVQGQPAVTRMVISMVVPLEYEVLAQENTIRVALAPKPFSTQVRADQGDMKLPKEGELREAGLSPPSPSEPRIFFQDNPSNLNQVLGIDFSMLDRGKSRVTVSTDKKVSYDLDRKGTHTLILKLTNAQIHPQLLREIDSSQFSGVVDRIRPAYSSSERQVTVAILLKEMVPFHVDQGEKAMHIDFGPTSIKPAEKKIVPLQLAQGRPALAAPKAGGSSRMSPSEKKGGYTGAPMTMDFVNADVTNILRLIGEVSNLNIVWGPEVRGTVSMRLKNVPWDQALDLVLANNNLAKREEGNVIWVTTKAQMNQFEAEEKRKRDEALKEIEEARKREEEARKVKEPEGTAYLTVNYKDVNNIKDIIDKTVKSEVGKITVDAQTKTIIYYDKVSKLKEARDLKERLDQATPQVMIEARIVEANTSFARSLGIQWNLDQQYRTNPQTTWQGTPPWAINNVEDSMPAGSKIYNPSFATNFTARAFPGSNLGLVFTKISRGMLTGTWIDAQLALSEADGKTRTLSSPKIVTRDTVKATIQQGTKIVIPSGTDANGNKTYQQVDASLKLEVKPQITPNNMVIMEVKVSDDQPDYANARGENIPINTKTADTTMMVASGETVVIGGIYKETEGDSTEGIPGLSKIPVLGWLFKANTKNTNRVELLIFLTPTVLSST